MWRVILGLGSIGAAGAGHHIEDATEVDPFGGEDRSAIAGLADAEDGIPVGEDFLRETTEVIEAVDEAVEGGLSGVIGGKAEGRHPAVAEDANQGEEFGLAVAERPDTKMPPVGLHLQARIGLEAHQRLVGRGRTQGAKVTDEGGIAASVRVVPAELVVEDGAPDAVAHR